jgi:7-cyano-7-deazaguanine synthase
VPPSIVLLSAGLDSAVNLKRALDDGGVAAALTFDYGQRAARREVENSAAMCARFRIRHEPIRLPWLARITETALVGRKKPLPRLKPDELDDPVAAGRSALRVWVPNRNGVFLAVAAAYAESLGAPRVVAGFNAEEAATFPDNSEAFARAYTKSLRLSTQNAVRVMSYTFRLRKPAIIAQGLKIGAPMDLVWPCYEGGKKLCGKCESCLRFLRAIRQARREDWFLANHPHMPAGGKLGKWEIRRLA